MRLWYLLRVNVHYDNTCRLNLIKLGFKPYGGSGVSAFFYDFLRFFSGYEGKTQRHEISECVVSRNFVLKSTKTLPRNAGFKLFVDSYFTSKPLIEKLLNNGFYVGSIRVLCMRYYKFESKKTMRKKGWGSTDLKILSDENIIAH